MVKMKDVCVPYWSISNLRVMVNICGLTSLVWMYGDYKQKIDTSSEIVMFGHALMHAG